MYEKLILNQQLSSGFISQQQSEAAGGEVIHCGSSIANILIVPQDSSRTSFGNNLKQDTVKLEVIRTNKAKVQ